MKNLVKAIIAVMGEVENIDKNMTVGSGQNSYQGVSDKDVKIHVGKAMQKNGLVMMPISVEPTIKVDRWEETSTYNGNPTTRTKQSVFTEVKTKYLLMHESGESMEIVGYGHGVDSQDKSAGKATTYALKNALLYTFLVPTGAIDDADKVHSDEVKTAPKQQTQQLIVNMDAIRSQIKSVKTTADLNIIWTNNTPLHVNAEFVSLVTSRKKDLLAGENKKKSA
ncbi:ERF superfamily [Sphingobacterium spiritivorum]|uniref:ERF superfamily n=1 Tax=Sphingobacterium spiritivorum TaxID=258 RepID=A0A380CDZ9_SPHSI|nr:ERF family protein [Sphingobacterium spiritivorum]SUJ18505.1 ERF superfamily [Sphingobacterium spiritivorum]